MKNLASILILALSTSTLSAGEFLVGFGVDDVFDRTDSTTGELVVEYHADPFYTGEAMGISLAGAGQIDGDGDIFIGLGVSAMWSIGQGPWFVEGSFMPGYYNAGRNGSDLGGNLQFRSLIGVGYRLTDTSRISVSIDHKSNASIEDINPGSETISLRYAFKM